MSVQARATSGDDHRIGVIRVAGATILIGPPSAGGLGELALRTVPRTPVQTVKVRLLEPAAAAPLRRWWLGLHPGAARSVVSSQALVAAVLRDLQSGRLAVVTLPATAPARGADPARVSMAVHSHTATPPDPGPRDSVANLDLTARLLIVVERAARKLPGDLAAGLRNLVTPRSIAMFAAAIAALAIGHAFGVGEAVDVVLIALAYFIGGMAAVKGVLHLASCAVRTVSAKTGGDLDEAAAELADAVEDLGVAALTLILVRAGSSGGGSGGAESEVAGREASAAGRVAKPSPQIEASTRAPASGSVGTDVGPADLKRPYIRQSVREEVEAAAPRTPDGRPIDPNTGQPIDGTPDFGHKPGNEFWREKQSAEAEGLTQEQFNDRMNDPNKYQLEDPSSNRSHRYERPR
jgi:hypothetical protein